MIGEKNGLDKFETRACPICNKEIILTPDIAREGSYRYKPTKRDKPLYVCSWKCYRLMKYKELTKKSKLTAEDVAWLRFARFPIPEDKLPKWMKEEDCPT